MVMGEEEDFTQYAMMRERSQTPINNIQCFLCGRFGHKIINCRANFGPLPRKRIWKVPSCAAKGIVSNSDTNNFMRQVSEESRTIFSTGSGAKASEAEASLR
ncbi:unnamed protein product [Gordionus sp. m RMFG-2023]